jgi:hypothetical protein
MKVGCETPTAATRSIGYALVSTCLQETARREQDLLAAGSGGMTCTSTRASPAHVPHGPRSTRLSLRFMRATPSS